MLKPILRLSAAFLVLPLLGGCPQVQNIRMMPDSPTDMEALLEQNEFARVRNLTTDHPELDTRELQDRIATRESAYADDMLTQARDLADGDELLKAVDLLTGALRRIPHNTELRGLRTALETERLRQLRINERNNLTARAEYLLDHERLYQQQINLQTPSNEQRREHAQFEKESVELANQLLVHARDALADKELVIADTCLTLARQLDGTLDTAAVAAELEGLQKSQQESVRQATTIRNARIKRKTDREDKHATQQLLATTQKALSDNKLRDAREAFTRIPPSTSQDSEVIAVQNSLDQAVSTRIKQLILTGDAQYRAEKIQAALKTWSEALALDPDNIELRERTDRANKVLANLEELKRQQLK
ncbi:MAG: hypothetical protein R3F42_14120 [Pseudomonadota bacterium]